MTVAMATLVVVCVASAPLSSSPLPAVGPRRMRTSRPRSHVLRADKAGLPYAQAFALADKTTGRFSGLVAPPSLPLSSRWQCDGVALGHVSRVLLSLRTPGGTLWTWTSRRRRILWMRIEEDLVTHSLMMGFRIGSQLPRGLLQNYDESLVERFSMRAIWHPGISITHELHIVI